jgi:serine/threonine protein kinase
MVLALGYLHQRGLIYRDLKPQNVLLNADGHVQLVDLGGIMDDQGTWTEKQQNEYRNVLPLFSQNRSEDTMKDTSTDADDTSGSAPFVAGEESPAPPAGKKKKKKQSIMGTLGYMAPEMVLMLNRPPMYGEQKEKRIVTKELIRRGYTHAVDWWSLGVTMYKLLTGSRPFADKQMYAFVDLASTLHEAVGENMQFREYAMLFQKLTYPNYISPSAQHFISQLLEVDDSCRLGAGPKGTQDVKRHPFFQGLDWDLLEQKQIEPPYIPPRNDVSEFTPPAPDLRSLLAQHGKENYMIDAPPDEKQKFFENW